MIMFTLVGQKQFMFVYCVTGVYLGTLNGFPVTFAVMSFYRQAFLSCYAWL